MRAIAMDYSTISNTARDNISGSHISGNQFSENRISGSRISENPVLRRNVRENHISKDNTSGNHILSNRISENTSLKNKCKENYYKNNSSLGMTGSHQKTSKFAAGRKSGSIAKHFHHFLYCFTHRRSFRTFCIRWAILLIVTILSVSTLFALVFSNQVKAEEQIEAEVVYEYFKNVQIEPGDTLWSYALEYAPDGNYKSYIKEVKAINHMNSNHLIAGESIILPYYSNEYF